jgi:hypothetical protein
MTKRPNRPDAQRPGWHGLDALEPRQLLAFIVWDGGGGDHSWDNPLNWSGDVLPGAADVALINAPGQQTVHLTDATDRTVAAIWSLDEIDMAAGSLTVTTQWRQSAGLTLSGGTIAGAAALLLNGDMSWTGGDLRGSGALRILPGRTLTIAGDVTLARPVTNAGEILWASGDLSLESARINNLAGATFTMAADGAILEAGSGSLIMNMGAVVRDGDASTTSRIDVTFYQYVGRQLVNFGWFPPPAPVRPAGTVEVRSGTLDIAGALPQRVFQPLVGDQLTGGVWIVRGSGTLLIPGGDLVSVYGDITLDGPGASFPAVEGAITIDRLTLSGGRALDFPNLQSVSLLDLTGSAAIDGVGFGQVNLHAGTLTYTGAGQLGVVTLDAGTTLLLRDAIITWASISGPGAVRIAPNVEWQSGIIDGPGSMVIAAGATFHIADNPDNPRNSWFRYYGDEFEYDQKTLARRTVNYGTILWDDGFNSLFLQGELVNRGTFTIDRPGSAYTYHPAFESRHATIVNYGTLTSTYELVLRGAGGGVELSNRAGGTVRVLSGWLRLYGGVSGSGSWIVSRGAALVFGGLSGALHGGSISGEGDIRIGNTLALDSVAVSGSGDMTVVPAGRLEVRGGGAQAYARGRFINAGTVKLFEPATLQLDADVINGGTLDLGYSSLTANIFVAHGTSIIRLSHREFVFPEPQLRVSGDALLGGTLLLGLDWNASPGLNWQFMSAPSHSGTFASALGADQAAGRSYAVSWIGNLAWAVLA